MEEGETREVGEEGSWDNPQGQMLPRGQTACHAEHRVESLPENQQCKYGESSALWHWREISKLPQWLEA